MGRLISVFTCEQREGACEMSKVLNEHLDHADGTEEGSHFVKVFAGTPVNNFVDSRRVRYAAFWGANVPYNGNLSCTQ